MTYQRRDFLRLSATIGAGVVLGPLTGGLSGCSPVSKAKSKINNEFGLQLYSLRDDLPKDPKGVLTQVAQFGYKQLEGFEGPQGMFWGMSNTDFKKFMDDLGMKFVASHCDINKDFERKAEQAAAIGMKYLIAPYFGPQKSIDDFKRYADTLNQRGQICKQHGLRFAYHNHDYSFKSVDGQVPQVVMLESTNKDLVDFEMDIYWVVNAGENPEAWMQKYPGRFRLCHVKDRQKGVGPTSKNVSVVLGTGSINFPAILKTAAQNGMEYYIVEQEAYEGTTPLQAAKEDAAYMKQFSFA
jgi:sugar phosphate isomerase/epimerase